jgi:uncharacterized transporter YbjL
VINCVTMNTHCGLLVMAQIRDETNTRIDLPSEASSSDIITITGKKENVEKARDKIEAIQKELVGVRNLGFFVLHYCN